VTKPKIKLVAETSKFIGQTPDSIRIYQVDGARIRSFMDVDFTQGAHWLTKKYIPLNEVWVEKMLDDEDECAILAHELKECRLMRDDKLSYDDAHKRASEFEWGIRHETSACAIAKKIMKETS
jgi:hypothetical protein